MMGGEIADELVLARRIQAARKQANLTQQQLCDRAGLAYSTLAKIERGAIKSPSVFTISNIASVCGIGLDELIGASPKKSRGSGLKFVYFDVNGCLIHFYQRAFEKLARDVGLPQDRVEMEFWHYNDDVCRGKLSMPEFDSKFASQLGLAELDWASYYLEAVEPVAGMDELIGWVASRAKFGLLTNLMPGIYEALVERKKLPVASYTTIIDSSKIGFIKPETEIYEAAQAKAKVSPNEILFIDDSRANLAAAARLGWRVMWFDANRAEESIDRIKVALEPPRG